VSTVFTHTPAIDQRLAVHPATLAEAESRMNSAAAYAAIVIPPSFTKSLVVVAGLEVSSGGVPATPTIELLTNPRLGNLGVSLATGVLQPAIGVVSHRVGQKLVPLSTVAARTNPVNRARLIDPIDSTVVPFRPLPQHSALGLSAFYVSLLTLMCGFLGATIIHSTTDAALGYATTEIGPKWSQRQPVMITRWHTLLTKWVLALVIVPVLTGIMLLVAAGILRIDAPSFGFLWLFTSFVAVAIAFATLVLFAALGTVGQLVALILFVYLALASSGGTVPLEAVPGPFKAVSRFEPLHQVLIGNRAILYFDARGSAGLTRSIVVIGIELAVIIVIGAAVTLWYDHRNLYRMPPELVAYVDEAVRSYR
jgi:hypothetical protein